ncbi:MAG: UDP-N-acetylmuramoyl-L-alanyl-D-glutamate--2,6-diaminopimelate ligase [Spirochaetaceae bacterium]|nr:MAG: UDP-N-acetylmuramoyl-L-alanyl-D-glutamate--2,6-diaminopimelate ligase [Spirochaetaceae bacterium]
MFKKKLSEIAGDFPIVHSGQKGDPEISGIAYDSRNAGPGSLFVALAGVHTDGLRFVADAVSRGASAVMMEKEGEGHVAIKDASGVPLILVPDARRAMSAISARLYDNPSEKLFVIGVTGTDGKSSTVWFIHQLLEKLGYASGFLSTTYCQTGDKMEDNPFRQSTPESPEIQRLIAGMVTNKKEYAVIEATSHGLSEKTARLLDVHFDAAVFTNIAHEHLEFHGTLEQYRHDKANLFRMTASSHRKNGKPAHFGVVNAGSPYCSYFAGAGELQVYSFGTGDTDADIVAKSISTSLSGSTFGIRYRNQVIPAHLTIPGAVNVDNSLAAILAVHGATNRHVAEIIALLSGLTGVRGRMVRIDRGQPFLLFVDFAHTPQAFDKVFPMVRKETRGRLISVFGSAGERDTTKRPMQGKAADSACDVIILTDEDPRGEDRMKILEDIASGCSSKTRGKDLFIIPDRREAIRKAYALAGKNDTVMLLGKGHEKSIIYPEGPISWNEQSIAEELLAEIGYAK